MLADPFEPPNAVEICLTSSLIPGRIRTQTRREAIRLALARECVLHDSKAYLHLGTIPPFWDGESLRRPSPSQVRYAGGKTAVMRRIQQGNLGIEDKLVPWTGELLI